MSLQALQDDPDISDRDRFYPAVLATSLLFRQMSSTKHLGVYGGVALASQGEQDLIMSKMLSEWTAQPDFLDTLCAWHPTLDPTSIRPFISDGSPPNIVSILHLIAQSIICEHVFPQISIANSPERFKS